MARGSNLLPHSRPPGNWRSFGHGCRCPPRNRHRLFASPRIGHQSPRDDFGAATSLRERRGLTRSSGLSPCDHDPASQTGSPGRGRALGHVGRCARPATRASGTCTAGAATATGAATAAGCPPTAGRRATTGRPGAARATRQTVPRSCSASAPQGRAESLRRNRLTAGVATCEKSPAHAEPAQRRERTAEQQRDRQRARAPRWRVHRRRAGRLAPRDRSGPSLSRASAVREASTSCRKARSSTDAVALVRR